MKASDLLVRCLEAEGIEYIFGVPGEENADFMMSLQHSEHIRFILTRHEQGAAFMAEVYGRLTGQPAGCLGTLGPGATNLITGVADSNMDRSPMLVLTGQGGTRRLHKESHQIMDVVEMFQPVTKWATSIINADTIPEIVRKAVRLARTEKPGAVHIELPEDVAKRDTDEEPMLPRRFRRSVPDDKIADRAFDMICQARRPVIVAGNGCIRKRASAQLRQFAEHTGIGVISTFMAKGCVDVDADYSMFTVGLGSKDLPSLIIDNADLVITVGFDMVEYKPRLWNPGRDKTIVHVDFLPAEIDEHYHPEVEMIGDVAHALWMLNERLAKTPQTDFDLEHQREMRRRMAEDLATHADDETEGTIRPQKAIIDARAVLGPDDILLSDVGAHKMWIARNYHCHVPNTCLIPNGFCSMGFALPGAIGAKLARPESRVLAICGDAGFLMNSQEIETALRIGTPIVILVWTDSEYGLITWHQMRTFGRSSNTSFKNPDLVAYAESFGAKGYRVEAASELMPILAQAIAADTVVVIDCPVDYSENMKLTEKLGTLVCPL